MNADQELGKPKCNEYTIQNSRGKNAHEVAPEMDKYDKSIFHKGIVTILARETERKLREVSHSIAKYGC